MFLFLFAACAGPFHDDSSTVGAAGPQMVYLTADYICPDEAERIDIPADVAPMHIEHMQEFMAGDAPMWREVPIDRFTGTVSGSDCGEDVVRGRYVFAYLADE